MHETAQDFLESARQLSNEDQQCLLRALLDEEEATWRKGLGDPDPAHSEWLAQRVEKSLADDRPGMPTEEAMLQARRAIAAAASMKQSA